MITWDGVLWKNNLTNYNTDNTLAQAGAVTFQKDTPLFVYCYSGGRSRQAADILKGMGYTNVKNLGGIASYTGKVEK